jgi:hypothetical protein
LVAEAGTTMTDIVQSVKRVTDIVGEITSAANEQSSGIGEINRAVVTLDQMTQQNSALVEESAAAASSMREQAAQLASAVSVFKVPSSIQVQPTPYPSVAPAKAPGGASHSAQPAAKLPAKKPAIGAAVAKKVVKSPARTLAAPKTAGVSQPSTSAGGEGDWETF